MRFSAVAFAILASLAPATAQTPDPGVPVAPAATEAPAETPAPNPDEMADLLNSQQQIRQGVTLTRTVNGTVVETKQKTIVYSPDDPYRATEAGLSPIERLKAEFGSQALTRKQAFEEARLDFVVADLNRDGAMDESEFVFLVHGWHEATLSGSGRGRFVDPVTHADDLSAKDEHERQARAKFAFLAGGAPTVSRKAYQREVLIDFDALDRNDDGILMGDELLYFRIANRGEAIADQPAAELSDK